MLEAGFLVLLAVVVGLADLSPALIVLVMTVGWLLVALIEYFAWRQSVGFATQRHTAVEAPPMVHEEVVEEMAPPPPPPPPPTPAPAEEETIVAPPAAEAPPPEAEEAKAFTSERLILHRLEPLQPRPRRRWIIIGPRERPAAAPEGDREEER